MWECDRCGVRRRSFLSGERPQLVRRSAGESEAQDRAGKETGPYCGETMAGAGRSGFIACPLVCLSLQRGRDSHISVGA